VDDSERFTALAAACRATPPRTVLVLGSGMGDVARRVQRPLEVPFAEVPGLPAASVAGHAGRLILGEWAGRRVLVFDGRLHRYEGHPWEVVVRPIQVAAGLGVRQALLTNAVGGIADHLGPGSLMAVRDHFEWTRPYWWRHPGPAGLGQRRPSPYSARLLAALNRAAAAAGAELAQGVYAVVTGPCYETPAEVRALRAWGADVVGMSTAREIQAGSEAGLACAAVSCITNRAAGLSAEPLCHEDVLATARRQADTLAALLEAFLRQGEGEHESDETHPL
jgi:purine-nucleoside phosphorylase